MARKFLILSLSSYGHANPVLALARELVQHGHSVDFICGENFQAAIEYAGAKWIAGNEDNNSGLHTANRYYSPHRLLTIALERAEVDMGLTEQLAGENYDAVLFETFSLAGPILAQRFGIPAIQLWASFAQTPTSAYIAAYLGETEEQMWGLVDHYMSVAGVEEFRPTVTRSELNISFLPAFFQREAETFADNFHFVGPALSPRLGDNEMPLPTDNRQVIFISLGTVCRDGKGFFRTCIQALTDSPYRVLMAIGEHTSLSDLGEIPDHISCATFVAQLQVLEIADLFVTHGGMNSTLESISCGVPMVLYPQQEEQTDNAYNIASLGMGEVLPKEFSAAELRAMIDHIITTPSYGHQVECFASEIRSCGGVGRAVDIIEAYCAQ